MATIWSEQRKYENWLRVELAATTALSRFGIVPSAAAESLRQRASFTVERIHAIEAETRHDVLAFTTAVAESVGPDARWLHYGLTSTDVVDTAQALALTEASAKPCASAPSSSSTRPPSAARTASTPSPPPSA
jgi:adenylosuccinate lyase